MSYSTALKSFSYGCSSFFAGLDAGWLWLAVPQTSRNARLLPLWFSEPSRLRAKMAPEWARPAFVTRNPLSQDGGQYTRPAGAQFLNLQQIYIQSVPRKRRPPTPHNLTSAFPLISILSTYRLFICQQSPETGAANLLRFDWLSWLNWQSYFPPHKLSNGGHWEFQSFPNSHGLRGGSATGRTIFCATQKRRCGFIIGTLGFPWVCQKLYPLAYLSLFYQHQKWLVNDPMIVIFLQVCQLASAGPQVEFTQVWGTEAP